MGSFGLIFLLSSLFLLFFFDLLLFLFLFSLLFFLQLFALIRLLLLVEKTAEEALAVTAGSGSAVLVLLGGFLLFLINNSAISDTVGCSSSCVGIEGLLRLSCALSDYGAARGSKCRDCFWRCISFNSECRSSS